MIAAKMVTVLRIQQLTGLLNFISRGVMPGRCFTRRFHAKSSGKKLEQYHHVKVDSEMRLDCMVWLEFLRNPASVARPFVDFDKETVQMRYSFSQMLVELRI